MATTTAETTETTKNDNLLHVVLSGGGPVGLTFALHLTMMMGKKVKITIHEGRWFVDENGKIKWQGEQQGKNRRDQVVTLQDHVIDQMPDYVKNGLFKNINERVWPTSRNIAIREVEDRLFDLIQPFVETGQIVLVPENLHEQSDCLIKGDFDALVGADGSNSFVRRYCNIQMISEGLEYACGVAYDIPDKVIPTEEPLHQALNCILTVSQTRYLVNSSTSRRGYLNIRLIKDEYEELKTSLEEIQARNETLDFLDTNKCPHSPIWTIVRQGLDFFKIPQKYVFRVIPIEINVRHASIVVRELRFEVEKAQQPKNQYAEKKYRTALAFLAGDAAMCVHFWPGRGMNSGMKGAIALARNIVRSCTSNDTINVRKPLRFLDFIDYEGFMARLRAREQQGRSLRVLVNPIDQYIQASYSYAHLHHCFVKYTRNLIEKLKETRKRLQDNSYWPHKSYNITDEELTSATNRIATHAIAQLSLTNPWPTREMSGADVLVETTFPYDLNKFLPVPSSSMPILRHNPSVAINYRFVILWVLGDGDVNRFEKIIEDIKRLKASSTSLTETTDLDEMKEVRTIEEAEAWVKTNRNSILQPGVRFKVVTVWDIDKHKTAIDVISTVRSESSRVPVLIYTRKLNETQAALEFPNVLATDSEFDVKEFVGIKQEAQWNSGYRVTHIEDTSQTRCVSPNDVDVDLSKQLLLWIDSPECDTFVLASIRLAHPSLEIEFKATINEAEKYIKDHLRKLQTYSKFIIISRGYYKDEAKSFVDIAQMFENLKLGDKPRAVYTKNKEDLLKKNPNAPRGLEVFQKREQLSAFINEHLK